MTNQFTSLVGLYFHTIEKNLVVYQGRVVATIDTPGHYLVECYDWITGLDKSLMLWPVSRLIGAHFYESAQEMQETYTHKWQSKAGKAGKAVSH